MSKGKSFYFTGPEDRLNLRARNLHNFVELAEGVDDETWAFHLRRGDYSTWIGEKLGDAELARRGRPGGAGGAGRQPAPGGRADRAALHAARRADQVRPGPRRHLTGGLLRWIELANPRARRVVDPAQREAV
ncbi:hypothetical protein ACFSTC_61730 [Nonomuraea ferruginea]